jgi:hypothetical protein
MIDLSARDTIANDLSIDELPFVAHLRDPLARLHAPDLFSCMRCCLAFAIAPCCPAGD